MYLWVENRGFNQLDYHELSSCSETERIALATGEAIAAGRQHHESSAERQWVVVCGKVDWSLPCGGSRTKTRSVPVSTRPCGGEATAPPKIRFFAVPANNEEALSTSQATPQTHSNGCVSSGHPHLKAAQAHGNQSTGPARDPQCRTDRLHGLLPRLESLGHLPCAYVESVVCACWHPAVQSCRDDWRHRIAFPHLPC